MFLPFAELQFPRSPVPGDNQIEREEHHLPTVKMPPTRTSPLDLVGIIARQNAPAATVTVTADPTPTSTTVVVTENDSSSGGGGGGGLGTGAIIGIVIGTIVGILLIWWIIKSCSKPAPPPDSDRQGWYDDGRTRHRSRSRHSHHSHHGHHHHHRHRSSTPRPVVLEEKYVPRRPSATYVDPEHERRSRSHGRSRSRSQGGYYVS